MNKSLFENTKSVITAVANLMNSMPEATIGSVQMAMSTLLFGTLWHIHKTYPADEVEGFIKSIESIALAAGLEVSIQVRGEPN